MYLVMLLALKRKLWVIFLPRGSSWSKHREAGLNLQGFWSFVSLCSWFSDTFTLKICRREWKLLSQYTWCFTELYLFYWLLVVSFSILSLRSQCKKKKNVITHVNTLWKCDRSVIHGITLLIILHLCDFLEFMLEKCVIHVERSVIKMCDTEVWFHRSVT